MKKNILLIIFTFIITSNINSQEINKKRVIDLNLSTDLDDLKKVGYGEKELKILSMILVDRVNKNLSIDTLTIENCLPLIRGHKFYSNDYFNMINSPSNNSERDILISYNDLAIINNLGNINNGIILFCNSGSINCNRLLKDLNTANGTNFLKTYKLYYYDLLKKEQSEQLIKKQKELLNSISQPHFAIVKEGKIVKDFIGYKSLGDLINKINE